MILINPFLQTIDNPTPYATTTLIATSSTDTTCLKSTSSSNTDHDSGTHSPHSGGNCNIHSKIENNVNYHHSYSKGNYVILTFVSRIYFYATLLLYYLDHNNIMEKNNWSDFLPPPPPSTPPEDQSNLRPNDYMDDSSQFLRKSYLSCSSAISQRR